MWQPRAAGLGLQWLAVGCICCTHDAVCGLLSSRAAGVLLLAAAAR
jgi:hypothetical protein